MLHHFRFLLPLLTNPREPSIRVGPDGAVEYGEVGEEELVTALHWYDAAVQVRRWFFFSFGHLFCSVLVR